MSETPLLPGVRTRMNQGAQLLGRGAFAEAAELFTQAQALQPDFPDAPAMLGVALSMLGDQTRAETLLRRALELAPGRAEFHQNLGLVLGAQGRLEDELAAYEHALRLEPRNPSLLEVLGQAELKAGRLDRAWATFADLMALEPGNRLARHNLAHVLRERPLTAATPTNEAILLKLLSHDNVEHLNLAPSIAAVLRDRYRLASDSLAPPLAELARDRLLINTLVALYLFDPLIERFLVHTRARLLAALADPGVDATTVGLAAALAVHGFAVDYVHAIAPEEQAAADALGAALDAQSAAGAVTAELCRTLVGYALYAPLADHPAADRLAALPADHWPPGVNALVRRTLIDPRDEAARAERIPSFGSLAGGSSIDDSSIDPMSQKVRAMYEAHPYPRWLSLGWVGPLPLGETLRNALPDFDPPAWADGRPFDVLIAGCGTGRHALRAATHYAGARVLAIDITRRSLAYAQRRAEELGLGNVEFLHGDVLEVAALGRQFQLIETIGTLETLDDPARGWAALRGVLADDGLLHVGAYSELARQPVVAARRRIAELGLGGTPEEMRRFRGLVMDGALGRDGERLLAVGDFYTLAGLRDFLFHVQEHRFDFRRLGALLDGNGLEFLGLYPLRREMEELLRERAPADPRGRELASWIALETEVPALVTERMNLGMYFLWCRPRRG